MSEQNGLCAVEPKPPHEEKEDQNWTATDLFSGVAYFLEDCTTLLWRSADDPELCTSYWELPDGRFARVAFAVVDPMANTLADAVQALAYGPIRIDTSGRDDRGVARVRAAAAFINLKRFEDHPEGATR